MLPRSAMALGASFDKAIDRVIADSKSSTNRAAAFFARAETMRDAKDKEKQADAIKNYRQALRLAPKARFAEAARGALNGIENLAVGMKAPEIVGVDLHGKELKLSEYKGKVIMLSFWGTWCGPCMNLIPHERKLADTYADKPFVILGINSDKSQKKALELGGKRGVNWRSFWNGPKGSRGPISTQWDVRGWPTIVLIDHIGIIRHKANSLNHKLLTRLIEEAEEE